MPPAELANYVHYFYQNTNALHNLNSLLSKIPPSPESVRLFDQAFLYRIDPLIIKSYLPTLRSVQEIQDFLKDHSVPLFVKTLLLIAAQTGNKDLAALAVQKGGLKDLKQDEYNACCRLYPLFGKIFKNSYIKLLNQGLIEMLSPALTIAKKHNQSELYTFLKNASVQSDYFKAHYEEKPSSIKLMQFKVAQQQENSSRASGYYAALNALLMLVGFPKEINQLKDQLLHGAQLEKQIEGLRSDVLDQRAKQLFADVIHDILVTALKDGKKISNKEVKKYKKLSSTFVLPLILEESSIVVNSNSVDGLKEDDFKCIAPIAKDIAQKLFLDHKKSPSDFVWIFALYKLLTRRFIEQIVNLREFTRAFSEPTSAEAFALLFDLPSKHLLLEMSATGSCISCKIAGQSKVYNRTYSAKIPKTSVSTAQNKQGSMPCYEIRKQIIESCFRKNNLNRDEVTRVSADFIESLICATNEWDKKTIETMIESAVKAQSKSPEAIMHEGESPQLFDETNNMPVDWDGSTVKTHMDRHLYAQWKKYEADRLHALEAENKSDICLASDWLSPAEVSELIMKKSGDIPVYYFKDNRLFICSFRNGELRIPLDAPIKTPVLIIVESQSQLFACFLTQVGKEIHLAIADSKNVERYHDAVVKELLRKIGQPKVDENTSSTSVSCTIG